MSESSGATTVAALFVERGGVYWDLPNVDPWDEKRDARLYEGPHPVVAHPPCKRWCRLAKFVQSQHPHLAVGDDGGLFAHALEAVRRWGGVLEHPAWSMAWAVHGLIAPPQVGWQRTIEGEWVCEVAQSAYGHRAKKETWILYVGERPPAPMLWEKPRGTHMVSYCSQRGDGTYFRNNKRRMTKREGAATPTAFRDVLLDIARNAHA